MEYLGIEDQKKSLAAHQKLLDLFPYNTPDRVILGCMLSYIRGCQRTIAVDDDNFTILEGDNIMVDLKQALEIALGSIFSSKLRSTLTTLGIRLSTMLTLAVTHWRKGRGPGKSGPLMWPAMTAVGAAQKPLPFRQQTEMGRMLRAICGWHQLMTRA